ncbi:penicillin-binding protein 1A [Methylococcus geothermalis]|uniref:penicillin-binding protein 1A n=1 Tax=Methylococcus geothermalis TaxID=2681310 RepID=UPI001E333DF6|nr:penicillin-binding protein 1A [Methylococcus geothermalis]
MTFEVLLVAALVIALGLFGLYRHLEPQLPDIAVLKEVRYQIPMSVYSRDGKLIAQFGEKKRSPVAIGDVPPDLAHAFIAAEDDRFYDHVGVDYQGILRAVLTFARTGEKRQGGSTITMQVARNFFLSSEKTFLRKVKEIMLAVRIDSELPKDQILELYLNKIYFGQHAYGIEAAAQVYYGKHVGELTLGEMAMIAGLPKAPSAFNPVANPERAQIRRNYVLRRMRKLRFITDEAYQRALNEPITARIHTRPIELDAPYVAEMVRAEMYQQYGEDAYEGGYAVYTTVDSRAQQAAESSLRSGLRGYDERHGYRGTKRRIDLKQIKTKAGWNRELEEAGPAGDTVPALVLTASDTAASLYTTDHGEPELSYDAIRWAKPFISVDTQGAPPRSVKELLKPGDVIRIRKNSEGRWVLTQIPKAQGALVELDADSGAIIAIAGGFDYRLSKFNRASQGQRQPGSGFKPVVYAAALESGFTPASVVNDSPVSFPDPASPGGIWRPHNYSMKYAGPTPLREALAKSRNMVSIRLLRAVGLPKVIELAEKFGFAPEELPRSFTLALGSGTASPLRMAQVYAVFANGGYRVDPFLISRIETQNGRLLYQATPAIACMDCADGKSTANQAKRVISEEVHYMMHSMLQDVVRRGTATKALELGRSDLAGKTGTTNQYRDAWFNGYAPGIVTVAWVGFDSYQTLGDKETGGQTALPIWIEFMKEVLRDVPERKFAQPAGIMTARVDPATGNRLPASIPGGIVEIVPRPTPQPSLDAMIEQPEASTPDTQAETSAGTAPESAPPEDEEAEDAPSAPPPAEPPKPMESLF